MAVETIHTYSLVHDDLPCMDDDDIRRGQPTNHVKFSEDMALLAGDSLLTESFLMLARAYPEQAGELIELVSDGAGLNGMIRGQVLDLGKGKVTESLADLIELHQLKTGRLIALCLAGPAILAGRPWREFFELGLELGLAFQVKDDLLDIDEGDAASFINFLGKEGSEQHLQALTEKIAKQLAALDLSWPFLNQLIDYNLKREK
jgi:geranylgeranyl diphosphate synthase type II